MLSLVDVLPFAASRDDDWHDQAECGRRLSSGRTVYNPDWWTFNRGLNSGNRQAIKICAGCSVRRECDQWADRNPSQAAGCIYGGIPRLGPGMIVTSCDWCARQFVAPSRGRRYCMESCRTEARQAAARRAMS